MNILIIGHFYSGAFGLHISETLAEMGHKPFHFEPGLKNNPDSLFGKRWNTVKHSIYNDFLSKIPTIHKINTKPLYRITKKNKIDLTIVLHDYLISEEVKTLKQSTKSSVVLWFPDALSNFKKSIFLIAGYDYLFFVDKYIVQELKNDLKLNTLYLPQACFPKYHKKPKLSENDKKIYGCDITNAGNMYPNRIALYETLTKYNVKMWGNPPAIWADNKKIAHIMQGKTVTHEEKAKAFYAAKIILNNLHPAVINGMNKRAFEAPACGAFQLVKYRPALKELFEEGKEVVSYKNYDDMILKIEYYLTHEKERKQIAEAGMKRAHKDHTLEIRLNKMINIIFN